MTKLEALEVNFIIHVGYCYIQINIAHVYTCQKKKKKKIK